MAVYTDVAAEDLAGFLAGYDIGELLSYKGIAEGVENSNFLVHTGSGNYILTLYERRVAERDLPFFLGLMEHLASRGITCPQPVKNRAGKVLGKLAGRPAAIVTFLDGMWIRRPTAAHCAALGEALARLHLAGADFPMRRDNALSVAGWRQLYEGCRERAHKVERNLETLVAAELDVLERDWPRGLPQGVIHADLFPDNVFFLGDKLSGLIDFYFACTDTLVYDVAICLNAWCFESDHSYNVTKGRALLAELRQDASAVGRGMGQAAAVGPRRRLALSAHPAGRLARRAARRAGAAEGPARICAQAPLPPEDQERARLRSERAVTAESPQKLPHVVIHTDGACSGNPGPGGWGAILDFRRSRERAQRRRGQHHQQSHGTDGGDLRA